jgi:ABC-type antimicrobial peptide transport system permease subunit
MALGARKGEVLVLVLRDGARLTGAGVALGAVVAVAAMRTLSSLLFGVSAADGWSYLAVSALLALVVMIASYLPARRATRVDPMVALRTE